MGRTKDLELIVETAEKEIAKWGPRRALINNEGEATTPERAYRLNKKREPDIIFIREDGWTLGTLKEWEPTARELWKDMWVAVIIRPGVKSISFVSYENLNLPK